ncbi:MAG: exodeoxyribonuclease VII small subunit [Burkholderiales bacterium]|nr:exodeoxyribonuclease VII small subunit [Burkholderiales bacterium]
MSKSKPSSSIAAPEQPVPESYEAGLHELESLVAHMESGQLPLAQLLQTYQRGAFLLNHCRQQLQAVEAQIKVLEAGNLKQWSGGE